MLNTIEGKLDNFDYEPYNGFVNFCVDGIWLDERLDEVYPNNSIKGLIPTLDYCLDSDSEKKVVWERIMPKEGETLVCPILMCPDDCDFSCTLICVEILNYGTFIQWRNFGLDMSDYWNAEKVGSVVKWFDNPTELNFEKADYVNTIESFRKQFDLDKLKSLDR